ncbi:galectin-related protein A isoform 2-T2 [Aplochiton taeniatus]
MAEKDSKTNEEYIGEIKGGMRPSMKLVVMGIVNKKPKSMEVSLSSDPPEVDIEGDVGLQVKMEIVCEHQQFRILVDGQPLCGFTHRLSPLASLSTLRVFGDVQLTKVA